MITWSLKRTLAAGGTLAAAGAIAAGATAATGPTGHAAAAKKVTRSGVDGVKLGMTYAQLRSAGRVGPIHPGCELGGPNTRGARLRAPLRGNVDFSQTAARRVTNITITGGASARGVHVGSTRRAVKRAFPKVRFDHSTDETFGLTLAKVPRGGGGRLQFAVDVKSKRVTLIGVPFIAFCE
ncbi:hypothetical protein [Capillimicrobium parvum]|uniref:Secreted protein n=1 Tax=Capillimicrobium parvum TaxID=2884022 RepID=A0A9E6XXR1_9ACTN|nr:hypothetical protein [Capillimicrobium parvum]UGS36394.1 hypothetical protein DSM104329_02798 [Capillimicrobium parvum]